MDHSKIIEHLYQFNQDELFYKEYYRRKKDLSSFEQYLATLNLTEIQARELFLPELSGNSLPNNLEENFLFSLEKNHDVTLRKHNRYTPPFFHEHAFFELIYVYSGSCKNTVLHETRVLKTGDLCLISPNIRHSIEAFSDDSLIINIGVRTSTFHDIFQKMMYGYSIISDFFISSFYGNTPFPYMIYPTKNDPVIKEMIVTLLKEQAVADDFTGRLLSAQLIILFTLLARSHNQNAIVSPRQYSCDKKYFEILNYIEEHYRTATLSQLAEHLHYTAPHCSKLIKNYFGCNFSALLQQIRLEKSKMLLENSTFSIQTIAIESGYESPEHFMRVFKKQYGMTPTQYRQSHN